MNRVLLLILLTMSPIAVQTAIDDKTGTESSSLTAELNQYINSSLNAKNNIRIETTRSKDYLIFFDTPELELLKQNASLVYHASSGPASKTSNKTKNNKIKKVLRYQYQQTLEFPVKQYDKVKSIMDKHPLFFMIKRSARNSVIQQLKADGIAQPLRMRTVFSSAKNTEKVLIFNENKQILTLNLALYSVEVFNIDLQFSTLSMTPEPHKQDNEQLKKLIAYLAQRYKNAREINRKENEYQIIYSYLQAKIGYIEYLIKYPEYVKLLMALLTAGIGLIMIKLLFWRRVFNKNGTIN